MVKDDTVVDEEVVEEAPAEEVATDEGPTNTEKVTNVASDAVDAAGKTINEAGKSINDAFKQVEKQVSNISKALGSALQDRANVVMVRVNDDSLHYLDILVEADITKSRSESAAFLINEGIKTNETLFNKIRETATQIAALKSQLRETVDLDEE